MLTRRNHFAETGAASSFKQQIEEHSCGYTDLPGVDHLGQITPFQRQVIDAANEKEAEEQERRQEEARKGNSGGRPRNSRAQGSEGSDMSQEETVRYVNKQENPDHDIHESD
jgi:hypothetical protein